MTDKQVVTPTAVNPLSKGHEDFYGDGILLDVVTYSRELWNKYKHDNYEILEPGIYRQEGEDTIIFDIVVDEFFLFRGIVEKKVEEINKEYDMNIEIDWTGSF